MDYVEFKGKKYPLSKERYTLSVIEEFRNIGGKATPFSNVEREYIEFHKKYTCPTFDVDPGGLFPEEVEELLTKLHDGFREITSRKSVFAYKNKIESDNKKNESTVLN